MRLRRNPGWNQAARVLLPTVAILHGMLPAQPVPPLTTIRDTIYKADGTRFSGAVQIDWKTFDAGDTSLIGKNRIQVNVVDGLLNLRLVPTSNAATPAYYSVKYSSPGSAQFSEAWAVPPAVTILRVRDVRIADPLLAPGQSTGGNIQVEIPDVTGLETELALRPKKGPSFTASRLALINEDGEIDGLLGAADECVRGDGTTGTCGPAPGVPTTVVTFADQESPAGVVDGINANFTLAQSPNPLLSLVLFRNGLVQKRGLDYTVAGNVIQFLSGAIPQAGDILLASYRTTGIGDGGTLPQVLCTGVGATTSSTTSTSLGACTIPPNVLRTGDRLEIQLDYAHQGVVTGWQYEVRVGTNTVASRSGASTTSLATGRASVGILAGAAQWSSETWGTGLAFSADVGSGLVDVATAVVVDFRGNLLSAGADTVTLKHFTVMRLGMP